MIRRAKDDVSKLKSLGSKVTIYPNCSGANVLLLERFPNKFEAPYMVELRTSEFTSLCPKTGQPDFGKIRVRYIPNRWCIESKGFKLYMFSYRGEHSFMETITNNILKALSLLVHPNWMEVTGDFAARGGVGIKVVATYVKGQVPSSRMSRKGR
jgi:7-cyano-7-deazaguanine reductase